jgi:hypothetical protein
MEEILAEVCKRDQFTCQQCGNTMAHVERYLVLHLVARTREARLPCEVVLEHASGTHAIRTPTRERLLTLGTQVIEHATAHEVDIMEAIEVVLRQTSDAGERKILDMMRKTVADSEQPSPC